MLSGLVTHRSVDNPVQRFHSSYVEWLEEPPPAQLQVFEETTTRTVLSRNDSPDLPFTWSLNPYRGCSHACAYCYARPSHEYLDFGAGTDFETKLIAKLHAPELLRRELSKRGWKHEQVMLSGDTDCYQPIEARYELTRRCLEAFRDHANPLSIVTKSFLITRDLELLVELSERADLSVVFSIPFADEATARAIEPGAPRPAKRLEALSRLSAAGLRTGVLVAPVIPGLNDREIPAVLERSRAAGASFAGFQMLRLSHSLREIFLERARRAFPDRAQRIENRIREVRGGSLNDARFGHRFRGTGPYWDTISQLFALHAKRLGFESGARLPPERARERPGQQLDLFAGD